MYRNNFVYSPSPEPSPIKGEGGYSFFTKPSNIGKMSATVLTAAQGVGKGIVERFGQFFAALFILVLPLWRAQ